MGGRWSVGGGSERRERESAGVSNERDKRAGYRARGGEERVLPDGHRYRPTERRDGACSRGMLEHVKGC